MRFVHFAESQAIMSHGGWTGGVVVDTAASSEQAAAVASIARGAAGGPLAMFAPIMADFRGVERHPVVFAKEGASVRVTIDGLLDQHVVGVENVSAPGACVAIDNTFHPANKRLNLATAVRNVIRALHRLARRAGPHQRAFRGIRLARRRRVNAGREVSSEALRQV